MWRERKRERERERERVRVKPPKWDPTSIDSNSYRASKDMRGHLGADIWDV